MGLLRAKVVFSHGFYTTYWDENAKMMTKQEQYTCLRDGTVYDNWRLPTNEEVKVICTYQFDSNSPIVRCSAASTCLLEQERAKMKHYLHRAGHSHIDAHR